tara:strand:- start:1254 stop:1658 length:405 start_codon:yes stop_codon:yes gene_type:complete
VKFLFSIWKESKIFRFLFVGSSTVVIDFIIYSILYLIGINTKISKSLGFISGTIYAYYMNKNITFKSNKRGLRVFLSFIALYITSLILNVYINETLLSLSYFSSYKYLLSFLIATVVSATINFIVMNLIIFKEN